MPKAGDAGPERECNCGGGAGPAMQWSGSGKPGPVRAWLRISNADPENAVSGVGVVGARRAMPDTKNCSPGREENFASGVGPSLV